MIYFERKNTFMLFFTVVLWLFATMFIFFLAYFLIVFWKGSSYFFVTKCSILDVGGVLNPPQYPQYAPTWIAYTNNLLQVW